MIGIGDWAKKSKDPVWASGLGRKEARLKLVPRSRDSKSVRSDVEWDGKKIGERIRKSWVL